MIKKYDVITAVIGLKALLPQCFARGPFLLSWLQKDPCKVSELNNRSCAHWLKAIKLFLPLFRDATSSK